MSTSLERVLTTLGHQEPDRVPLFLLVTMHGATELGLSIKDYFSKPEHVTEGQLRLQEKFGHDCLYNFYYAPLEIEAFGGEVVYATDGPPNSGRPFITSLSDIDDLTAPDVSSSPCLEKVLESARMLKQRAGDDIPVIGVVMSPFSLPVMQMGFENYMDLMFGDPQRFNRLMAINEDFCVRWANAQLDAGATAICYFDPVSSSTITTRERYLETGCDIAKRTLARINGPTATHMASGRCLPIVADIAETGTAIVGVSRDEDLSRLKKACRGKLALLGNLNGIEMRRWTPAEAEAYVKQAIASAGRGGGFILADNHGEIPFQVPEEVLTAVAEAARKWGRYPLDWIDDNR